MFFFWSVWFDFNVGHLLQPLRYMNNCAVFFSSHSLFRLWVCVRVILNVPWRPFFCVCDRIAGAFNNLINQVFVCVCLYLLFRRFQFQVHRICWQLQSTPRAPEHHRSRQRKNRNCKYPCTCVYVFNSMSMMMVMVRVCVSVCVCVLCRYSVSLIGI